VRVDGTLTADAEDAIAVEAGDKKPVITGSGTVTAGKTEVKKADEKSKKIDNEIPYTPPESNPDNPPSTDDPGKPDNPPNTDDPPNTDNPGKPSETPDTTAPADVTGLTGTAGNGQVTLNWTNLRDKDMASIKISWTPGNGTASVTSGTTYTATNLTNGTAYTFTLKAVDTAENESTGVKSSTLTPLASTSVVKVVFGGLPQDETITLTPTLNQDTVLSWKDKTELTVIVGKGFTNHKWDMDGVRLAETGDSLTLKANELSVKPHKLTVFVTKNGVEYAKILNFTVTL
jgi:hypothetical protein